MAPDTGPSDHTLDAPTMAHAKRRCSAPVPQSVGQARKELYATLNVMQCEVTYRVLVVDAERAAFNALAELLTQLHTAELRFEVCHASSSEEAVHALSQSATTPIDIALVSLELLTDYACACEEDIGSTVVIAYGADALGAPSSPPLCRKRRVPSVVLQTTDRLSRIPSRRPRRAAVCVRGVRLAAMATERVAAAFGVAQVAAAPSPFPAASRSAGSWAGNSRLPSAHLAGILPRPKPASRDVPPEPPPKSADTPRVRIVPFPKAARGILRLGLAAAPLPFTRPPDCRSTVARAPRVRWSAASRRWGFGWTQ